ncbi:hypothetical protein [Fusobacterium nucleatum]|uniref:hypothetical protein n=1 Tax=Fusobacterium nucleatum TaxID=851 RepID=UPI001EEDA38F|nr:hypothetical protein [Fusobacterium nucleatum]MCG6843566.1 hypothetical protein [Fusobacterium nucleatum]
MDFRIFFMDYKKELGNIEHFGKKFLKKFLCKIICLIPLLILALSYIDLKFTDYLFMLVILLVVLIFLILNKKKLRKGQDFLTENYKIYSLERKKILIKLLKKYNIEINNIDLLNNLINEANKEKKEEEPFKIFQDIYELKKITIFSIIIIPIINIFKPRIIVIYNEFKELINKNDYALILFLILIIIWIIPFLVLYIQYFFITLKYNYLIYDLRQLIIFNGYLLNNVDKKV